MPDLNDLIAALTDAQGSLPQAKQDLLQRVGQQTVAAVQAATPVDSGKLRDSIHARTDGDNVEIVSDVEYAPYVDQGHVMNSGTFVPGRHMFDKALLGADRIVAPEVDTFLKKLNL